MLETHYDLLLPKILNSKCKSIIWKIILCYGRTSPSPSLIFIVSHDLAQWNFYLVIIGKDRPDTILQKDG